MQLSEKNTFWSFLFENKAEVISVKLVLFKYVVKYEVIWDLE